MFAPEKFDEAIRSALDQLATVQTQLETTSCPEISSVSINLRDLNPESIEELIDEVPSGYKKSDKGTDYIYLFQVDESYKSRINELSEHLDNARKTSDDYCRINPGHDGSVTIYVGRSKTLKARLRQHLGAESRGIYAMHLQRWATPFDVTITIRYMKFGGASDLLVQAIEDGLWASLRPAFGKKGEQ